MASALPGWRGSSFHKAGLIPLKALVLVEKGQIVLWFGVYHCWSGARSCQSKEDFISACDKTQVSLQEAAKEQKRHWGESNVPMGLRCCERDRAVASCCQLFWRAWTNPGNPQLCRASFLQAQEE